LPFSYFRGAALAMAADLAVTPVSGLAVQACGDAHLSNFGVYASPERALVFDLNDFDETLPGPWEWDVKRLASSLEVAGRENAYRRWQRRKMVTAAVCRYREAMRGFADQANMAVWYARAYVAQLREQFRSQLSGRARKKADQVTAQARTRDSMQAVGKLTRVVDGRPRIVADPPLVVPVADLVPAARTGRACRPSSQPWSPGAGARWESTAATCWSSSSWRTRPARWSAWAAWEPAAGSS
jgi:uncharacterized protein (DUF2252 family)